MKNTKISLSSKDTIYTQTSTMTTTKTYQWLKGDRIGQRVKWLGDIAQDNGLNFLVFTDGSRGNEDLIGDYFVEILDDAGFVEPTVKEVENVLPPEVNPPLRRVETVPTTSPISALLNNSKKTKSSVSIGVVIDMPSIDLMRILSDSYENGEEHVKDYLANSINMEEVRQQIATQIWIQAFSKKKKRNETA
jgi:hypothetical protein